MNKTTEILIVLMSLGIIWGDLNFTGETGTGARKELDGKSAVKQELLNIADMVEFDWSKNPDTRTFKTIADVKRFQDLAYTRSMKKWSFEPIVIELSNELKTKFDTAPDIPKEGNYDAGYVQKYCAGVRRISNEL